MLTFIYILFLCLTSVYSKNYTGFKVYQLTFHNVEQKETFLHFGRNLQLDTWRNPSTLDSPTIVVVPPIQHVTFLEHLVKQNVSYNIFIENLATKAKRKHGKLMSYMSKTQPLITFENFNSIDQINNYLDFLGRTYPHLAQVVNIGRSYEGREMKILKVSTTTGKKSKPALLIDGGIHAREWIGPAQVLYIINQLVENSGKYQQLVENLDWYFMPVLNPDGYAFTFADDGDRFWRKTRSGADGKKSNDDCIGVDANRNFNYKWNATGAAGPLCTNTYPGKEPMSEQETQIYTTFATSIASELKLYLSFHSYGNYILYSWGHTYREFPDNKDELQTLGEKVNSATKMRYRVGSTGNLMYLAGGQSQDWFKAVLNIPLSYTIELPGGGDGGFDLEPEEILPIVTDMMKGVIVFAEYVTKQYTPK